MSLVDIVFYIILFCSGTENEFGIDSSDRIGCVEYTLPKIYIIKSALVLQRMKIHEASNRDAPAGARLKLKSNSDSGLSLFHFKLPTMKQQLRT